ncbi:MAG: calcium/proton exchanger [Thermoplasmata archaeon]|nr:MAG: calcium/proton exchanger [Thermoplasmata archaeon]
MAEAEETPQEPDVEDEGETERIQEERDEEPQVPAPKESITGGTGVDGLIHTRLPLSRIEKGALILLIGAPIAIFGKFLDAPSWIIFLGAAGAIMPLALLMGRATEELAIRSGPGLSAFLLATFGNATELIIAVVAVNRGLVDLARASLVGSIIINVLLVMGLSFLVGGIKFPVMNYSRITASATLSMLTVSVVAVMLPSLYFYATYGIDHIGEFPEDIKTMSLFVAAVLLAVYVCYMIFSMRTHKKYFDGQADAPIDRTRKPEPHLATWPASTAITMLAVTMISVVGIAELLIGEIEHIMENAGLSDFFMGVVVIALVGNAAEHSSAILMAWRGRIELSFQIAMGSSVQIALLIIPILVLISMMIGNVMAMVFTPLGLIAIIATLAIAMVIALDGQATWFEGLMLLAIFVLISGIAALV